MIAEEQRQVVLCHVKDNVVTALSPMKMGSVIDLSKGKKVEVKEEIPFAHKIALRRIPKGGGVVKYGERIGRATRVIQPGELVHIHNVTGERGKGRKK